MRICMHACLHATSAYPRSGLPHDALHRTSIIGVSLREPHLVSDAGTRLLFRSGTHGLNKELGRYRGREGKLECILCGAECESVAMVHVLWECLAHSSSRASFTVKLEELLGDRCELLNKTSYLLGSEFWEQNYLGVYINLWEVREQKYDEDCMMP